MPVDFDRHNQPFLRTFGEDVKFWPGEGGETLVTAVLYTSARAEGAAPGNVERLWIRLAGLPALPVKGDTVEIGGAEYSVGPVEATGDGSAIVLVRKKG